MQNMRKLSVSRSSLIRLEAYLEGVFENFFGQSLGVESIMRAVTRALEDTTLSDSPSISSLTALHVELHPLDHAAIQRHYPFFERQLAAFVRDAARQQGILVSEMPTIQVLATPQQARGQVSVQAMSPTGEGTSTERLERHHPTPERPPRDAAFLKDGNFLMPLQSNVINIGRRSDNQLVLDDPRISRHHCQLRLRQGRYHIYDLDSTHGVYVNQHAIREHILNHGDVVSLGGVNLVYVEEDTKEHIRPLAGDTSLRPPRR